MIPRHLYFQLICTALVFFSFMTGPGMARPCVSLISPEQLQRKIADPADRPVILDARLTADFRSAHIPGARGFDWQELTITDTNEIPYRLPEPEQLASILSRAGADSLSTIIVYGSGRESWGGEGWTVWVLSWLGHKGRIYLLKGGWKAWTQKGFPAEPAVDPPAPASAEYHYELNPDIFAGLKDLQAADAYLVDTRTFFERVRGTIPGSIGISWKNFFQKDGVTPIGREDFARIMAKNGIEPGKPVIYYCTGGIRSAWVWLVHCMNEYGPARNFEGSIELWQFMKEKKDLPAN